MAADAAGRIELHGMRELSRAFKNADKQLQRDLRTELRDAAEPVRATAQELALSRITRIGLHWSRMRVGVTTSRVYVAPSSRGARIPMRKRPKLADLLMSRAMLPALEQHQQTVERNLERMLDRIGDDWAS